jgi:predicted PurR-regulated permease PerM
MPDQLPTNSSPRWSSQTKLVVALSVIAILAVLVINFRHIVGPLLMAFIISYLFYPLVSRIRRSTKISWRLSVGLLYLFILVLVLGLLTWGGITIVEQIQSLISFVNQTITELPNLIEQLSHTTVTIGPFVWNASNLDLSTLGTQFLNVTQPVISQMGSLFKTFASSAASLVGWVLFVLLVSFFIMSETEGDPARLINIKLPGYNEDFRRLGLELGHIWNAFLRGQLIIIGITIIIYTILLGILGVKYFYVLALLAGMARFVPYVGPAIAWTTLGLVAYFQGYTIFGLSPLVYALICVGVALLTDNIIDQMISPRLMADSLRVHPAAVMVTALIAASLLGLIGVMLAAPVLATCKLFLDYMVNKLFDLDPWANMQTVPPPKPFKVMVANIRWPWQRFAARKPAETPPSDGKTDNL